jgi:CRP-like cAMP-binding protein
MTERDSNLTDVCQDFISRIPFFGAFTDVEREQMCVAGATLSRHEPGNIIIEEGALENTLFVLLDGQVSVVKESEGKRTLAVLEPGAIFGEVAFSSEHLRTASIIAIDNVTVFALGRERFEALAPVIRNKILDQILQVLHRRLSHMDKAIRKLVRVSRHKKLHTPDEA